MNGANVAPLRRAVVLMTLLFGAGVLLLPGCPDGMQSAQNPPSAAGDARPTGGFFAEDSPKLHNISNTGEINSIGSFEITDGQIGIGELSDASVTGRKLNVAGTNVFGKIFIADGSGASWAYIGDGDLRAPGVPDGQVLKTSGGAVAWGSVTTTIPNDSVTAAQLAADSAGSSEIAADAVGSSEIADNAVGTGEIADGAVTSSKLSAGVRPVVGFAQAMTGPNVTTNYQSLVSVTLNVPSNGKVLVIGNVGLNFQNGSQTFVGIATSASGPPLNFETIALPGGSPAHTPVTTQWLDPVTPGSRTYHLVAIRGTSMNTVGTFSPQISATFIPD